MSSTTACSPMSEKKDRSEICEGLIRLRDVRELSRADRDLLADAVNALTEAEATLEAVREWAKEAVNNGANYPDYDGGYKVAGTEVLDLLDSNTEGERDG